MFALERRRPTRPVTLRVLVLLLASCVVGTQGGVITPETCAQLVGVEPDAPLLEKEHCSVCAIIVENSKQWNWGQHYESLCAGMPSHALSWCQHYACKLAECPYFKSGSCQVVQSKTQGDVVTMSPCPAKYICSYCLAIPRTQVFGCFDGLPL